MKLTKKLIIPKIRTKFNNFQKIEIKNTKRKKNLTDNNRNPSNSWDFTPFPEFFFPSEKKEALKKLNNLDFKNKLKRKNFLLNSKLLKCNSLSNIYMEHKGDITKNRAPAFSFGTSRGECKNPLFDFKVQISPSPGSYNLRPLIGLGGSSLRYSINNCKFKKINKLYITQKRPGPGSYNINKCDSKYNGKIILSNYSNSPICKFGNHTEKREGVNWEHSDWNVRPDPQRYNINNSVTMFSGTGRFPLSIFKSNVGKSINKINCLSKFTNKFITPGPGYYNHHSIFMGHKF